MSTATRIKNRADSSLVPQLPDFCPACDAIDNPFQLVRRIVPQDFRGETLEVAASALACRNCGFEMAAPGHLDQLRLATLDAYRLRHGLLTSAEIVERRTKMGMSQRAFADHIGVGVASLQRWEKGLVVQDKAGDVLLRVLTEHTRFAPDTRRPSHAVQDRVTTRSVRFSFPADEAWKSGGREIRHATTSAQVRLVEFDCNSQYALAATA